MSFSRYTNAALLLFNLVFSRLSGLLRTLFVTTFLTPESASIGFLAISIGRGSVALMETGTRQVVITRERCDKCLLASAWWVEFIKGLFVAAILLVGAGIYSWQYDGGDPVIFLVSAAIPLCMGVLSPFSYLWERERRFGLIVLQTGTGTAIGLFVTGGLLWSGTGWIAMPAGIAIGLLAQAIFSHLSARQLLLRPFSFEAIKGLVRDGLPFTGISIATYIGTLGIDIVLALCGAINWVAPYRTSMSLVQVIVGSVAGVVGQASLPEDARLNREKGKHGGRAADFHSISMVILSICVFVPFCIFALPTVAVLLFGKEWSATELIIPSLAILVGLRSLSTPMATVLLAAGNSRFESRTKLMEAILTAFVIGLFASTDIVFALQSGAAVAGGALVYRIHAVGKLRVCGYDTIKRMYRGAISISATTIVLASGATNLFQSQTWRTSVAMGLVSAALSLILILLLFFRLRNAASIGNG